MSRHLIPIGRESQGSLNIIKASGNPDECLNLKSEWSGAKLPNLQVSTPKGIASGKHRTGKEDKERVQETVNKERRGYVTTRVVPRKFRKQNLARE